MQVLGSYPRPSESDSRAGGSSLHLHKPCRILRTPPNDGESFALPSHLYSMLAQGYDFQSLQKRCVIWKTKFYLQVIKREGQSGNQNEAFINYLQRKSVILPTNLNSYNYPSNTFNWECGCIWMFHMMCMRAFKISIYTSVAFYYLIIECRDSVPHVAILRMKVKMWE